jgi:hypothetical protein
MTTFLLTKIGGDLFGWSTPDWSHVTAKQGVFSSMGKYQAVLTNQRLNTIFDSLSVDVGPNLATASIELMHSVVLRCFCPHFNEVGPSHDRQSRIPPQLQLVATGWKQKHPTMKFHV